MKTTKAEALRLLAVGSHTIHIDKYSRDYPRHYTSYKNKKYSTPRLIYTVHTGETLRPDEIIHHIDGDPYNNNINNLLKTTRASHPSKYHASFKRPSILTPHERFLRWLHFQYRYCDYLCNSGADYCYNPEFSPSILINAKSSTGA